MTKFTLFTLFLATTIVVIVAELLVNDYIRTPDLRHQLAANVFQTSQQSAPSVPVVPDSAPTAPTPTSATPGTPAVPLNAATAQNAPSITFSLINESGFKDATLQRVPFNGVLFESIDLRDFKSVPVLQQNLLENNKKSVASFYEFNANSRLLANEIYDLLKGKSGKLMGASINETNSFGDRSFFVNFPDRKEQAFLIVKLGDRVYALSYVKGIHASIVMLFKLLS